MYAPITKWIRSRFNWPISMEFIFRNDDWGLRQGRGISTRILVDHRHMGESWCLGRHQILMVS